MKNLIVLIIAVTPLPTIADKLQTNIGISTDKSPVVGIEYFLDNDWFFGTVVDIGNNDYQQTSIWQSDRYTFKSYDVNSRASLSVHTGYLFTNGLSIRAGVYLNKLKYGEGLTSEVTDTKDPEIEINDSGVREEITLTPMLGLGYDLNEHYSIGINQSFSGGGDKFTQFTFGVRI